MADVPLIVSQEGSSVRTNVLAYFKRHGVTPKIVLESSSVEVSKELVLQRRALCFMTFIEAMKELKEGTLKSINIHEGLPEIRRVIIHLKDRPLSPSAKAFIRVIETDMEPEVESLK